MKLSRPAKPTYFTNTGFGVGEAPWEDVKVITFERWRSGLELAIVRWLEQVHGTPYWIARDVAQDVVKSTKGLRALYRKGLTPSQAALDVASKLPQSELIKP